MHIAKRVGEYSKTGWPLNKIRYYLGSKNNTNFCSKKKGKYWNITCTQSKNKFAKISSIQIIRFSQYVWFNSLENLSSIIFQLFHVFFY